MSIAFGVVVVYLTVVMLISIYYSKLIKTSEDFTVAGRTLPGIIVAGTLMATWMGSGTVVGGTNSLGFKHGPWVAIIFSLASPVGIVILYLLSNKINRLKMQTVPDVLQYRYGESARILGSLIIMIAYVGIVSYQFKGIGFVLQATLGIPSNIGTLLGAAVVIGSAVLGGLYSVAYTDFLSACLMLLGLCIGVPLAISHAGGWSAIAAKLPPKHLSLGGLSPLTIMGYFFPLLFLILGDQNMYQRFFAARDPKAARWGAIGWFLGVLIVTPLVAFGATAARALYPNIPAGMALIRLASSSMPTIIGALCLAAITAFIITTGNSYLLSSAVNLGWDIYTRLINPEATDRHRLLITRWGVVVLGILAYLIITFFPTVLSVQMYAYTMYGASITPALLAAVISSRITPAAGISSMLVGAIATIAWEIAGKPYGLASVMIAAPLAIITLILVNLLSSKRRE
ncbi:MAG: sodium:solute symporter family protein [Synergistetes bacterium]|nr:sodium:solute symporter family protein [Synergistota bacterium]